MLKIVCVNVGNWENRGIEYADKLYDQVTRNLKAGTIGQFIVFTDNHDEQYAPGITVRQIPSLEVTGWYSKLSLYKAGVFDDGDRIIFLDLDTVITSSLD